MNLNVLIGVILVFGLFGIIGAISASITTEVQADQVVDSYAWNISENSLEAQDELSGWTPTIALAVAAGIVITAVLGFLAIRNRGGM